MSNPSLAVSTTNDPIKISKELFRMWESFLANGRLPEKELRSVVSESWKRCSISGLNPRLIKAQIVLSEEELYKIKMESELVEAARPIMEDLAQTISGTKHVGFLCNSQGQIVEEVGDANVQYRASLNNLVVGADWSEEGAGTNAIGTAIKQQGPVQVFSAEHFCEGWHTWTCSATLIRDPFSKDILGVLDLTGLWNRYQSHSLGLVMAYAKAIERSLYQSEIIWQYKLANKFLDLCSKSSAGDMLVVDKRGRVTHLNEGAAKKLGVEPGLVIGQTLKDFPELNNVISEMILRGEPNREYESLVFESRSNRELRLIGKPVVENGKLLGALITLPDGTSVGKSKGSFWEHQGDLTRDDSVADIWTNTKRKGNTREAFVGNSRIDAGSNLARYNFSAILGKNELFLKSIEMAKRAAYNDATILVQGESGTGKELVAQAIHLASKRASGSFIAINCGALPKDLVGSELFGYAEGAFTGASKGGSPGKFELANGGTIFLDEIGEMPADQQVNLLRILQEKEVVRIGGRRTIPINVRVIAATNKNLSEQVRKGYFREDLFYRINVISISLPALRERREDISLLITSFLEKARRELDRPFLQINNEAMQLLEGYNWPGNIRELRNVIERAVLMTNGDYITPEELPSELLETVSDRTYGYGKGDPGIAKFVQKQPSTGLTIVERVERDLLLKTVEECNDNMTRAAAQLKMARSTLYRKLKRYGCV